MNPAPPPPTAAHLIADPAGTVLTWSQRTWDLAERFGPRMLGAMLLLFAAYLAASWARRLMLRALTRAHVDLTLSKFLSNITRWSIVIFALITSAGTLGLDTTGLAAALAAASLAIGLALQGNLSNLACGVLLMIFRPFKIGDSVVVAGQTGIIDGIDLFTTYLDTADNRRVIVPNGAIFGGVIENQTYHERRQAVISVPVTAAADPRKVREVLLEAARRACAEVEGALSDPTPAAVMTELAPNPTWTVTVWSRTGSFGTVRQALLWNVKLAVDAAGLTPPPPSMRLIQTNP